MNSYTWPPTNVSPSMAVAMSHSRIRVKSRWSAAVSASTIVSELASSTNDETDVYRMSKISLGYGPVVLAPRYRT